MTQQSREHYFRGTYVRARMSGLKSVHKHTRIAM